MEVSVLILNWNAAADTIRCVKQFSDWRQVRATIWVVDNGSQDGSIAEIKRACPEVRLVQNGVNLGFSGATNQGIRAALAAGDAPILFLNNDAFIDEAALCQMLQTMAHDPTLGMVGPLLYSAGIPSRLIAAGSKNPVLELRNLIQKVPSGESVYEVDYVSGSVALLRAEALCKVGALDEEYFFYTEVADWCRRARQHGYRTVVDTRAQAKHNLERSSELRNTLYVYYLIRNRFIYIRKTYCGIAWVARPPLYMFWGLYSLLLVVQLQMKGNQARSRAVWIGLTDGISGKSGGQNERVLAACSPAPVGATVE